MGKLTEIVDSFSRDYGSDKEYAKEVKVTTATPAVLRFLDGPDAFVGYYISWILCDDEKPRSFVVENDFEGKSLLGKMFGNRDSYYEGGYFETTKNDYGKVNTYQAKDPDLYKVMTEYWNASFGAPATAKPKLEFIYNVIHRNPEVVDNIQVLWCSKEKKTKITRLGQRAMLSIKKCVGDDGDISEYDVNYTKEGNGKNTVPDIRKAGINVPYAIAGFLKEEEKAYQRNDLKYIVKLSQAYYCLKHIPTKIKRMDVAMGTNYYAEFEKQASIENAQWQEKLAQQRALHGNVEIPSQGSINVMTPPPSMMQPNMQQPLPFDDSRIPLGPNPVGAAPQEGSRRVLSEAPQVAPCFQCGTLVSQGTIKCTKCGVTLMEPCAVCQNMISSKATVCLFCGAKYTVS